MYKYHCWYLILTTGIEIYFIIVMFLLILLGHIYDV